MSAIIPDPRICGYQAAAKIVERHMRESDPGGMRKNMQKLQKTIAFREGYHQGLLFAHCQHVLGECAESPLNINTINEALADNPEDASR